MPARFYTLLQRAQKSPLISGLLIALLLILILSKRTQKQQKNLSNNIQEITEIKISDLLVTSTGLKNVPDERSRKNLQLAIDYFFSPLQQYIKASVKVNSGFRSKAVNDKVGGVPNSKHLTGKAFDFYVPGKSSSWLYQQIQKSGLMSRVSYIQVNANYIHLELK